MKKLVQLFFLSVFAIITTISCSKDDEPVVIPPAKFTIDLTTKNFGDIEAEKKASQTFKISNTGGQNLELKSFTLTGTNKAEFNTNAVKTTLKSGENYSFTVNFVPTAEGNKTATVSIATNVGTKTITLKGNATPKPVAMFSINPTSKDFGDIEVNQTANQLFTITNTGNASLEITGYSITGTNANQFSVNSLPTAPFTIAAGETKDMTIIFSPTTTGSKSATLKFITNIGEQTVSLTGNATAAAAIAVFSIDRTSRNFGDTMIMNGATPITRFAITNTGNANLEITGYSITGANADQFRIWNSSFTTPTTITTNSTVYILISFTPTSIGNKTATLKITTNVGEYTVSLSGKGIQPATSCATPVNIPDANFKAALLDHGVGITNSGTSKIDTNGDGIICTDEASAYTGTIYVYNKGITDLTGVEAFTNITELSCSRNQLASLDVTENTSLTKLVCDNNQLTSLDVTKNTSLTLFYCNNNQLTSLDITKNISLTYFDCIGNQLTSLDVTKNTSLIVLSCNDNQLTSLDLSANQALTDLICQGNELTSLNTSANTVLQRLYCANNKLTNLNVSTNTALKKLYCNTNQLTSLNVSANTDLKILYCGFNKLTNLNVSTNTALQKLYCNQNQLTSLNVANGNNGNISYMWAQGNPNLSCIKIDSGFDPTTNTNWQKDSTANWNINCR